MHLEELRLVDPGAALSLLAAGGLVDDSHLVARVTTVKAAHLTELRSALTEVYTAAGLPPPGWTPVIL